MHNFANSIGKLCLDKYNSMKKTGKPGNNEWTVLAGIILKIHENTSLVSLATGTKCLGGNELVQRKFYDIGERLSDSHAEVLARRAFLLYLYDQIDSLITLGKSEIFVTNENDEIVTKPGVSFHFYCSQTPCGDCSIIPMSENEMRDENRVSKKRKMENCTSRNEMVDDGSRTISDIHRTGAKCLINETKRDQCLSGMDYHVTGPLRTKPGRGDPTLSLSCSDKLAKWNAIGIQGSFLSFFISSLRLETIVIGGECPFSQEAMERGVYKRFGKDLHVPNILQANLPFSHKRNAIRFHPCPSSIVWSAIRDNRNTEIIVDGRKQGATKNRKGSSLLISRKAFLRKFLNILDKYPRRNNIPSHPKKIYYNHCKQLCRTYQSEWKSLKAKMFSAWPEKPMILQNFAL